MKMPYTLRFHPDIEGDLQKICAWYEEKLNGLGDDFLQVFYSSIEIIKENPLQYPKIYKNFHRYLLQKFPYVLYYLIEDELVIIMGLFHHSRDPHHIKSTIGNRKN